jgi:hypothetical protein
MYWLENGKTGTQNTPSPPTSLKEKEKGKEKGTHCDTLSFFI